MTTFPSFFQRGEYWDDTVPVSLDETYNAYRDMPYLTIDKTIVENELSGVITIAYDEINPIEYFGKALSEYYTKFYPALPGKEAVR